MSSCIDYENISTVSHFPPEKSECFFCSQAVEQVASQGSGILEQLCAAMDAGTASGDATRADAGLSDLLYESCALRLMLTPGPGACSLDRFLCV